MTQGHDEIDVAAYHKAIDKANRPIFTKEQGSIALERYGLGNVLEWAELEAGFVNSVYRAISTEGCYIVKIKFRPGFSLPVQFEATQLIRTETSLPVCDVCILDEDIEPFGHPFLICNGLPGNQGQILFERAGETIQRHILREYGRVAACLHGLRTPNFSLPQLDCRDWRGQIRRNFLDDEELIAALPLACQRRVPIIADLLDEVEVSLKPVPQGFVWGDAMLRNLLLDDDGQLTGVIDFESAAWGDLLTDQLDIESEFKGRSPREVYGRADFRAEFWNSYEQAGGVRIAPDKTYVRIRTLVQASGFGWLWKAARVLSPKVPTFIENMEGMLRKLQAARS